jgi:hypothetical protein
MGYTDWALAQIQERRPETATEPRMAYEELVASLRAVAVGGGQFFGLNLGLLDVADHPAFRARIVSALVEWKQRYERDGASAWLLDLDRCAKRFEIPELAMPRLALRCDPIGGREGLSPRWLARLTAFDAAQARLDLAAVGCEADVAVLGPAHSAAMVAAVYERAVLFERATSATFSRELAAWWAIADSIFVDGYPLLVAAADWSDGELGEVEGLRIGAGRYFQGSLFLVGDLEDGLDAMELVETDDEIVTHTYENFGAYVDLLLGAPA